MFVSAGKAQTRMLFETQNESQQGRQSKLFNYLEGIWRNKLVNATLLLTEDLVVRATGCCLEFIGSQANLGWRGPQEVPFQPPAQSRGGSGITPGSSGLNPPRS